MKKVLTGMMFTTALVTIQTTHAANYSAGAKLGSPGIGASFSLKNELQLRGDDQFQTRFEISGLSASLDDDLEFAGIDYGGDFDTRSARATMDWYPFANGNRFFVSAGLDYTDFSFNGDAESDKSYTIGSQPVNPGDNVTTSLDIDANPLSPYLGIGWGNRIGTDSGFSFQAELGILIPTSDADVKLKVTDPGNTVSDADIRKEKKQIENNFDGVSGLASIGVLYHF